MSIAIPMNPKPLSEWKEAQLGEKRIVRQGELAPRSEKEQQFAQNGFLRLPKMPTTSSSEKLRSHGNLTGPAPLPHSKTKAGAAQETNRIHDKTSSEETPSASQGQTFALPSYSVGSYIPQPPATPQASTKQNGTASIVKPSKEREPQEFEAPQTATPLVHTSTEAPPKKRRKLKVAYRCRHGCTRLLSDKNTLRAHHQKVHNCFDEGTVVKICGLCTKKFANEREYKRHSARESICWNEKCKEWKVPAPQTMQERADTWAYRRDGSPSPYLVVPVNEHREPLELVVVLDSALQWPPPPPPSPPVPVNSLAQDQNRGAPQDGDCNTAWKPTKSKGSMEDPIVLE